MLYCGEYFAGMVWVHLSRQREEPLQITFILWKNISILMRIQRQILGSALHPHRQYTNWGNIFWKNINPYSTITETCRIGIMAH